MIAHIINWSIKNRIMVLLITVAIVAYGVFSIQKTPLTKNGNGIRKRHTPKSPR